MSEIEMPKPEDIQRESNWSGIPKEEIESVYHSSKLEEGKDTLATKKYAVNNPLKAILKTAERIHTNEVQITGKERIPQNGGFVVAFQHAETFNTSPTESNPFFWLSAIYESIEEKRGSNDEIALIAYRANAGLRKTILEKSGALFVEPGNTKLNEETLNKSKEVLRNGGVVLIAPEGRRSEEVGGLVKPKRGVGELAMETDLPIVPIAFYEDLSGKHVHIGKPLNPEISNYDKMGQDQKKIAQVELADKVMESIANMTPPRYRGEYSQ